MFPKQTEATSSLLVLTHMRAIFSHTDSLSTEKIKLETVLLYLFLVSTEITQFETETSIQKIDVISIYASWLGSRCNLSSLHKGYPAIQLVLLHLVALEKASDDFKNATGWHFVE